MEPKYEIIIFWSDEDNAFVADIPELPGCMADGQTYQEALSSAEQIIKEWIETAQELGRPVPKPRGRLAYALAGETDRKGNGVFVDILNATEARSKLYRLIDQTNEYHQPIVITGKRKNAVLVSEEDWNAISETLHLLSIPGMRESIKEGLGQNKSECSKELDW
jgi:prevent-host-death family protein